MHACAIHPLESPPGFPSTGRMTVWAGAGRAPGGVLGQQRQLGTGVLFAERGRDRNAVQPCTLPYDSGAHGLLAALSCLFDRHRLLHRRQGCISLRASAISYVDICSALCALTHARKLKGCLGVQITSATLTPVIGMIKVCPLGSRRFFFNRGPAMCAMCMQTVA